jgi:hypothetical protein
MQKRGGGALKLIKKTEHEGVGRICIRILAFSREQGVDLLGSIRGEKFFSS